MAGADNEIPSPTLEPPVGSPREADASLCQEPFLHRSERGHARSPHRRSRSRSSHSRGRSRGSRCMVGISLEDLRRTFAVGPHLPRSDDPLTATSLREFHDVLEKMHSTQNAMLDGMRTEQCTQTSAMLGSLDAILNKQARMIESASAHSDSIVAILADHLTVIMETRKIGNQIVELVTEFAKKHDIYFRRAETRSNELLRQINQVDEKLKDLVDWQGCRR